MRRAFIATLLMAASLLPTAGHAIEPGGDRPWFDFGSDPHPLHAGEAGTVFVTAFEPDSRIAEMRLCVDGSTCTEYEGDPAATLAPATNLLGCLSGDERTLRVDVRLPDARDYAVQAWVLSAPCSPSGAATWTRFDEVLSVRPTPPSLRVECATQGEPGASDVGVTPTTITVGATVVRSGVGGSFLAQADHGIDAAVNAVNDSGGVCGRRIVVDKRDDGWDAHRGMTEIRSLKSTSFALTSTSSEGLAAAIAAGVVDGFPTVGTNGLASGEFESDWVWPVGVAPATPWRIIVANAYERGARTFGLVFDARARMGTQAREAFAEAVRSLPGARLVIAAGVQPGQPSYPQTASFNDACGCDVVAIATDRPTAHAWIRSGGEQGSMITAGGPSLMSDDFARHCGDQCDGMELWSGFSLPIGALANDPHIDGYRMRVRQANPNADTSNALVASAYTGAVLLARALGAAGVNPTREGLRAALDATTLDLRDLANTMSWSAGNHNANRSMRAFRIVTAAGSFAGFRPEGAWVRL